MLKKISIISYEFAKIIDPNKPCLTLVATDVGKEVISELTERSEVVDEYIYDAFGEGFNSPITGEDIDMAEYCFVMESPVYYNIAQSIIASRMDEAIQELETTGHFSTDTYEYKLVENKEETV